MLGLSSSPLVALISLSQGIKASGGHDGNKNCCQDDKPDQSNLLVSGSLSHQRCTRLGGHERLILTSSQVLSPPRQTLTSALRTCHMSWCLGLVFPRVSTYLRVSPLVSACLAGYCCWSLANCSPPWDPASWWVVIINIAICVDVSVSLNALTSDPMVSGCRQTHLEREEPIKVRISLYN